MGAKYQQYLASREWALRREAVRERSGGICERCRKNPMQAVHHLTYAHIYNEPLEDLQAICDACHAYESGKSNYNPAEPLARVLLGAYSKHAAFEAVSEVVAKAEWPEHFAAAQRMLYLCAFGLYTHPQILCKKPYGPGGFMVIPAATARGKFIAHDWIWLIDRPSILLNCGFNTCDIEELEPANA